MEIYLRQYVLWEISEINLTLKNHLQQSDIRADENVMKVCVLEITEVKQSAKYMPTFIFNQQPNNLPVFQFIIV